MTLRFFRSLVPGQPSLATAVLGYRILGFGAGGMCYADVAFLNAMAGKGKGECKATK